MLSIWLITALVIFVLDLTGSLVSSDMKEYRFWGAIGFSLCWPITLLVIIMCLAAFLFSKDEYRA